MTGIHPIRKAGIVACCVLCVSILYVLLYHPSRGRYLAIAAEINTKLATVKEHALTRAPLHETYARLAEEESKLAHALTRFQRAPTELEAYEDLSNTLSELGLRVRNFIPQESRRRMEFESPDWVPHASRFQITFSGKFAQVVAAVKQWEALPYELVLETLVITPGREQTVQATADCEIVGLRSISPSEELQP